MNDVPESHAERTFPGLAFGVRQARRWSSEFMDTWGIRGETREDTTLVLTELTANAVQHTRSGTPGGEFRVRLRLGKFSLWLEITDQGSETSKPELQRGGAFGTSGRGLAMVEALTERWWVDGDANGRTVVAAIPRTGPHPALSVLTGTRSA